MNRKYMYMYIPVAELASFLADVVICSEGLGQLSKKKEEKPVSKISPHSLWNVSCKIYYLYPHKS